jgi:hypothetical protein
MAMAGNSEKKKPVHVPVGELRILSKQLRAIKEESAKKVGACPWASNRESGERGTAIYYK